MSGGGSVYIATGTSSLSQTIVFKQVSNPVPKYSPKVWFYVITSSINFLSIGPLENGV